MYTLANLTSVWAHGSCSETSELTYAFHHKQELLPDLLLIPFIIALINQLYSRVAEGL